MSIPVFGSGIALGGVAVRPVNLPNSPASTAQTMFQQYEVESYNSDGQIVTRTISYAQLVDQQTDSGFDSGSLTGDQQASEARLLQSAKFSAADADSIIQDSIKVDYLLGLKSQQSIPLEFNTLQTPGLDIDLQYNFYTRGETNTQTEEDQSLDPFLLKQDVPRYVQLTWDPCATTSGSLDFATRTQEEASLAAKYFNTPRGTATVGNAQTANSFKNNAAKTIPLIKSGNSLKLVDTHDLERGFNSTSNSRLFKNAALAILNINSDDANTISLADIFLEDF